MPDAPASGAINNERPEPSAGRPLPRFPTSSSIAPPELLVPVYPPTRAAKHGRKSSPWRYVAQKGDVRTSVKGQTTFTCGELSWQCRGPPSEPIHYMSLYT